MVLALNGSELGDLYRKSGVGAVAAKLENELASYEYWKNYLSKVDTSFGFYDKDKDLLIVGKGRREMLLWRYRGGTLSFDSRYSVRLGKNSGAKMREGDRKTPIGAYRLVKKLEKVDQFYGPLALVTEYPNLLDRLEGRNGGGIWVHGFPLNSNKRDEDTRGCVALDNNLLLKLKSRIDLPKSRIIIFEEEIRKVPKEDIVLIMSMIYQWRKAWADNDLQSYLSFYADEFRRYDGMKKEAFSAYKKRIFDKGEEKEIIFHDFEVAPNPTLLRERVYKVNFEEEYRAPSHSFSGTKELYIKVADGKATIIAEQ